MDVGDPRPDFVAPFRSRGLFYTLFVLCVFYAVWFAFVIVGENQEWGDDPGRWALLPTTMWGFIGLALLVIFIAYSLAVLTIRERPAQIFRIEAQSADASAEPVTPTFLQPKDEETWTEAPKEPGQG